MMLLLDSNILLEVLLDQDRADEVDAFLRRSEDKPMYVTDLSLYSIGIILFQRKKQDVFARFWADMLDASVVRLVNLNVHDMPEVLDAAQRYGFDFDDAYQYVTASKYGYTLVSFDAHFDRSDLDRKTPGDVG